MKLRPFELALVVIFAGLALLALVLLANYEPDPDPEEAQLAAIGQVTIWGTLPAAGVQSLLFELAENAPAYEAVSYRYIAPEEFGATLITALADDVGPDLVLISHEKLVEMRHRIQPISYENPGFSARDIRDKYADGAQIFALSDGLYGYPLAIDPLMLYWNRDLLTTAGFLSAPRTWEELINTMFPELIQRDFERTIQRSVVALGEYGNVRNAFGIISALMIQGGSERVLEGRDGSYLIRLQNAPSDVDPLRAAADFYTRFSRPSNALYSWNRAFTEDRQQFAAEDLVFYFGYGSEGPQIERINPNFNFDIAEIPQGSTATTRRTYGKFYSLALLKSSDNPAGANLIAFNLTTPANAEKIAVRSDMVPVYRAAIQQGSNDTYGRMAYQSASVALGWLNPELAATDRIFATMTEDINENRREVGAAVSDATSRLRNEY